MSDWRSDSKWRGLIYIVVLSFSKRIWYKITSRNEWFLLLSSKKVSIFQVMFSAVLPRPKKWCFIWAWLCDACLRASHRQPAPDPYNNIGSVGIKQTLQQTCFTRKRKLRSKFWWLTRFCNSHDVSHFAAFFIVVGAKTSVAESGLTLRSFAVSTTPLLWKRRYNKFTEWVSGQLDVLSTHGFRMSEIKIKNCFGFVRNPFSFPLFYFLIWSTIIVHRMIDKREENEKWYGNFE